MILLSSLVKEVVPNLVELVMMKIRMFTSCCFILDDIRLFTSNLDDLEYIKQHHPDKECEVTFDLA